MKRLLFAAAGLYVAAAAIGHALERSGATRCECAPECWCRRPGLSALRWVFPFAHGGGCATEP